MPDCVACLPAKLNIKMDISSYKLIVFLEISLGSISVRKTDPSKTEISFMVLILLQSLYKTLTLSSNIIIYIYLCVDYLCICGNCNAHAAATFTRMLDNSAYSFNI